MKPDGQNSVIQKWMLPESLVFRPLVKGNEDSGNEIALTHGAYTKNLLFSFPLFLRLFRAYGK